MDCETLTPRPRKRHPQAGHDAPWVLYRLEENQDVISNLNDRREEYKAVRVSQDEIDIR